MKRIIALMSAVCFCLLFCMAAQAAEEDEWESVTESFDVASLEEATPQDVLTVIKDLDIHPDTIENISSFSLLEAVKTRMLSLFSNELAPLQTLRILVGLALLAFLSRSLTANPDNWQGKTAEILILIACGSILIHPIGELFDGVAESIRASVIYQRALLPVYAGLLTASGHQTLSGVYSVLLLGYDQIVSTFNDRFMLPFCRMLLALIICLPLSGSQTLSFNGMRKAVVAVLTTLNAICTALLTAQARISAITDRVAVKAAKASLTALVPIVGTSLSESLSIILDSMDLAKTTIGVYTIVTITLLFLPPLVRLLLWKAAFWFSGAMFDAVGAKKEKTMIASVSSLLTIVISIVLSCAVFLMVTTIIVMSVGRQS